MSLEEDRAACVATWEYNQAKRREKTDKLGFFDMLGGKKKKKTSVALEVEKERTARLKLKMKRDSINHGYQMKVKSGLPQTRAEIHVAKAVNRLRGSILKSDAEKFDWINKHPGEIPSFMSYDEYKLLLAKYGM